MTYPDAQPVKILVVAKSGHYVSQAIVAAVAATLLEPGGTGWNVQFIVGYEDLLGRDFIELCQRRNGLAAAVHKRGGNQQPQIVPGQGCPSGQPEEF